jgi:beta-lactamase superfamily II metal-dependent hydrolase
MRQRVTAVCSVAVVWLLVVASAAAQQLEIHQINVGWGMSVLVKGPDGTTVLLEAGNTGKGIDEVVPYLQSIGITPAVGLDYTIAGHQHCDHIASSRYRIASTSGGSPTIDTRPLRWLT